MRFSRSHNPGTDPKPEPKRRISLRIGAVAAGVLAGGMLLSACGAPSTQQPAAAPSESTSNEALVIYSGRSENLVGPLLAQFTQDTGIQTEVRYGDTAELAAQIIEEGNRSPADVFFAQDAGALGAVENAELFTTLPSDITDLVPAQYRSEANEWTGVTGRSRVIAYDSQQLAETAVPASVWDLVDPRWNGQVGIAPTNASFQSFVTAMRVTEGDDKTQAWLEGLVANNVQKFEKNGLILDAVNTGQIQLGLINHYYWFEKAGKDGATNMRAQIKFSAPGDPGALVNVAGVGVLATSTSENANTFVKYLLSDSAQQYFAEKTYEYPLVSSVDAANGLPALSSLQGPPVLLERLDELPATQAMLQEVGLI